MNAIEKRISTTFAPGILTEIRGQLNDLKGKICGKNWDRMNNMLRARSRFLSRGVAEETIEESTGLPPAKVERKIKWIQITRTDRAGKIWLNGWRRPKNSRKAHIRKMLKTPQLLSIRQRFRRRPHKQRSGERRKGSDMMRTIKQLRKLSNIQLRILVAELSEPKEYPPGTGHDIRNEPIWMRKNERLPGHDTPYTCPDYTGRSDAARKLFVEHLPKENEEGFWRHLHALVMPQHDCDLHTVLQGGMKWQCLAAVMKSEPREVCEAYALAVQE